MSILDLQAMTTEELHKGPPARSGSSKNCGNSGGAENTSTLSVAICAF